MVKWFEQTPEHCYYRRRAHGIYRNAIQNMFMNVDKVNVKYYIFDWNKSVESNIALFVSLL